MKRAHFDVQRLVDELETEFNAATDRGLPLVGAAGMDRMLEILIDTISRDGTDTECLFTTRGPMSDFSSKIMIAHAFALISNDERRELDLIRKVRNLMAHELGISFVHSEIQDRCRELVIAERLYTPDAYPALTVNGISHITPSDDLIRNADLPVVDLRMPNANDPRRRFHASLKAMTRVLGARISLCRFGLNDPAEFSTPVDLEDARIKGLELNVAEAPPPTAGRSFEEVVLQGYKYSRALLAHSMGIAGGSS